MIIKFIDKNGNRSELITESDKNRMSKYEKIGKTWFEKRIQQPVIQKVVKVEVKEEVVEEVKEITETNNQEIEIRAKEFLKEKKVRGFGLLKGDNLIKKAVDNGFII
jgi:acetylornithine/succinyldiaminopimelate/putrescine aminotransferase